MSVLAVEHLCKSFGGVAAVQDVSFGLDAGEMLALIGPNGAGKTTCFNMLGGQLRPDAGRVLFKGGVVTGLAPRLVCRLGVGRTFQIAAVFGSMTVAENVQMALLSHRRQLGGLWRSAASRYREEAAGLLQQVGLADQADRTSGMLAYGDVKRLELAMALAQRPSLLLMDEPTAGMAPRERAALMQLVASIARADQVAVLFTEHDMDAVFAHADRIVVLDRGKLVAEGSPAVVRANVCVQEIYLGTPRSLQGSPA